MSEKQYKTTTHKWFPGLREAPDPTPPDKSGKWKLLNVQSSKPQPDTLSTTKTVRDRDTEGRLGAWFPIWKEQSITVPNWDNSITLIWTWEKES